MKKHTKAVRLAVAKERSAIVRMLNRMAVKDGLGNCDAVWNTAIRRMIRKIRARTKREKEQAMKTIEQEVQDLSAEVGTELLGAISKFGSFASAHEGYAVILEEMDELWEHVKTNAKKRDVEAMRKEAMQVAAMAMRFMLDVER